MAARIAARKSREAEEHMKNAKKAMSTGLFRWKPDLDTAAAEYEKAATCYRVGKVHAKAREAFILGAEAREKLELFYSAGKDLESAAMMAKEEKLIAEAGKLYERSAEHYREANNLDKAGETLTKAGRTIEKENASLAVELYKQAIDIFQDEEKDHYAKDTYAYCMSLLLREKNYSETLTLLERRIAMRRRLGGEKLLHKLFVSVVVIHLFQGDFEKAERAYQQFITESGFVQSEEGRAITSVLDAYESGEDEEMKAALKNQTLKFLDAQIARLCQRITPPLGGVDSSSIVAVKTLDELEEEMDRVNLEEASRKREESSTVSKRKSESVSVSVRESEVSARQAEHVLENERAALFGPSSTGVSVSDKGKTPAGGVSGSAAKEEEEEEKYLDEEDLDDLS